MSFVFVDDAFRSCLSFIIVQCMMYVVQHMSVVGLNKLLVIKRVMLRQKSMLRQNCQMQLRNKLMLDHGQFAQCLV